MRNTAVTEKCRVGSCSSRARYECPRCAVKYCSVLCYRRHSERCVAAFAKQADEHLRGVTASDLEKTVANRKLRAALEELEESNPLLEHTLPEALSNVALHSDSGSSDECGDECDSDWTVEQCRSVREDATIGNISSSIDDRHDDIADVLEGLVEEMEEANPSFEEIIHRLPKHMVDDFFEMVNDGRIGRFLPVWRPWWLQPKVIEEGIVEDPVSSLPPPKPKPTSLTCPIEIARRKGSPRILFNIVDVVYGYSLMMRVHNGDWRAGCTSAARFLWEVCSVLAEDARHASIEDALNNCLRKGREITGSKGAAMEAVADASTIVGGRKDWLSRALWEVYEVFEQASTACKGRRAREITKRKLKVGFLVSWSLGTDDLVFVNASREISSFFAQEHDTREQLDLARRVVELTEQGGKAETIKIRLP